MVHTCFSEVVVLAETKRKAKLPLSYHKGTQQYYKKINGKFFYFGKDLEEALERYYRERDRLEAGQGHAFDPDNMTLRDLCNLYLGHQEHRVAAGELGQRHLYDQTARLREFAKFIGPNRKVAGIKTLRLQQFKADLISRGLKPNSINNRLRTIKSMFIWAEENEVIEKGPNLKAVKPIKVKRVERQTFRPEQIAALLENATPNMKAMILLALNCGLGPTDCAELQWGNLDLEKGRMNFPRPKTGVDRNLALWPETIEALKALPQDHDLVFITHRGHPYVRILDSGKPDNAISKEFNRLVKETGIDVERGCGFYSLRRTAATMAAASGDVFAVQRILGHRDTKMASTYVQNVDEQTDRVVQANRARMLKSRQ